MEGAKMDGQMGGAMPFEGTTPEHVAPVGDAAPERAGEGVREAGATK